MPPRSFTPRKYRTYRERRRYRKRSDYRDEYSCSRSRSPTRPADRHRRRHRHYDNYPYKDSHSSRRKHERSEKSDRSRRRRSSSDRSRKHRSSKNSKKHYKQEKKHKHYYERRDSSSPYSEKKKKKRSESKESPKREKSESKDRTQDAGHYKYKEGDILRDEYKIIRHLGDGTFGRVLEIEDIKTKKRYAMKAIRAVKRYVESAKTEADILLDIKDKDPNDEYKIVRLESAFLKDPSRPHKEQNYFMIFEKLGMSLYDFLKLNDYRGFTIDYMQSFAKQILISIGFMHSIGLTHTDLKPENILLVNDEREAVIPKQSIELEASNRSRSEEKPYYKPKYDALKIIDMGGATYDNDHHSSVINTRQYRAPEVMLACEQWGHESDVWSIGCILLELWSGELFFETHETYEHLSMIDKACGPIPFWMADKAESKIRKHFILDDEYYRKNKTYFDWPKYASGTKSLKRVDNMQMINDVISSQYPEFRDLIKKMLTIDPKKRITCSEALQHDFFKVEYK